MRLLAKLRLFATKTFEDCVSGTSVALVGYHWSSLDLTDLSSIADKPFYFCDDPATWDSSWVKTQRLYKVSVSLKKPKVFLRSKRNYEQDIADADVLNSFIRAGYDSIVYTPSPGVASSRQGLAFHPKTQIKSVQLIY